MILTFINYELTKKCTDIYVLCNKNGQNCTFSLSKQPKNA